MKIVYRLYGKTTASEVEEATGIRPTGALIEKRKGQPDRLIRYDVSRVNS